MGRGKLPMEFISNHKARKLAMQKRKMNLKKKAHELSTLCDAPVCVIMYNPDDSESEPALLYPDNRDEAQSIINRHLGNNLEIKKRRRVGDGASTTPDWSRDQLLDMAAVLDHKLQFVQSRLAEFQNNANLGQNSGASEPDFDENAISYYYGSQFGSADQQQLLLMGGSTSSAVLGFHANGISFY